MKPNKKFTLGKEKSKFGTMEMSLEKIKQIPAYN